MSEPELPGDEGSVLLLVLGLFAVLLVLVAVVVDTSAVVLAKRSLASTADGAAVSAAQALDQEALYAGGLGAAVPLSEDGVRARVAAYAAGAAAGQSGLALAADVEGGRTVVVEATRTVRVPFGGWVGIDGVDLTAVARARAPVVVP